MKKRNKPIFSGADRPRSPAVEARIRERNRRVIMTVSVFLFLAAGTFLQKKCGQWQFQETSVPPKAVVIEVTPVEKTREEKLWEQVDQNREKYPADFLEALKRNPEALDFAVSCLTASAEPSGGITLSESRREVPLFIQWDKRWGYVPYGQSNIGISGCGPTCLSMVLYSLTRDKSLTPDLLAGRAMEEGYYVEGEGTSWLFMEDMAKEYGVEVTQFAYMGLSEMERELDEGRLIICAMGPGDFTDNGHFIVVRGHTGSQMIINDPFSRSNSGKKWEFDRLEPQIQKCWVYEGRKYVACGGASFQP